ncbi:E3 ubiquitin-protein ligase Os04g0590900-like [Dendrobium catenatum]|uniref:RING-type E3 ubiquitin transferase n=1 Tax=Dendrobium catenatum TaxID=906689 RepID=A0A2I0WBR3_9ASPA|nr:E3 ubiquitin-protein ligase Os04g0590900-like [Dendrobium catenatum]PKU73097.1 E3 ubiquitin-protein ligase [Dendrobium catenatum]
METIEKHHGLVPLEDTKDCSHGFCTIFCPQWCYILFPPPPSLPLSDDEESSGSAFSPLVIGIIGILGAAFLLIGYYTVVTKYRNASLFRRRGPSDHDQLEEESVEQSQRQESWHLQSTNGLDEALIAKITVCWYKRGDGLVDGTDCSVCLAEFREGESLRLLPKCSHAFHLQCIDTWLKSHSNCPLCRASIVVQSSDLESRLVSASDHEQERVVVVVDDLDLERNGEEEDAEREIEVENEGNTCKDFQAIEIGEEDNRPLRRSVSMGSVSGYRVLSIADVLQESMEDGHLPVSDARCESTRRGGGENSKGRTGKSKGLHSVMSSVQMKRSVSSGKSCFTRKGRGGVRFFCFEELQQKSDGEEASSGTSSE